LIAQLGAAREEKSDRPELWFPVGERLTYKVYWGIFPVAETKVTNHLFEEEDGEEKRILLAIQVVTKSYALLDTIYPVDDFIESVVDPVTFKPLRFTKRLSEGRYRLNEVTLFNHNDRIAHWKHLVKNDTKDFAIEDDTRDLMSFMYFMRSQKFAPNTNYHYRVMADEKLYDLFVHTKNIVQLNLSKFGPAKCLYIEPEAKFQGLFVRTGTLQVWISRDARCLCAKAVAKAPIIGSVKLLLDKVEGPGNDSWVKNGRASAAGGRKSGGTQHAD
jgi:hypothetical protein